MAQKKLTVNVKGDTDEGIASDEKVFITVEPVDAGGTVDPEARQEVKAAGDPATATKEFMVEESHKYMVIVEPSEGDWVPNQDSKVVKVTVDRSVPFPTHNLRKRTDKNKQPRVEIEMTRVVLDQCKAELEALASNNPTGSDVHTLQTKFKTRFNGLA